MVEHVHVHKGGQAIVGNIESSGGGFEPKAEGQPRAIAYAPGTTMSSADQTREPLPISRDEERPLPDARRDITGRSEG
jgi:hypothetical protein